MESKNKALEDLIKIMEKLRSKDGCPWDREQTHESISHNLLEEAYEVYEAIKKSNDEQLKEELGDLLLQVVFHAQIAKERGAFDIYEVADEIKNKLIRRHPHVFGDKELKTSDEVLQNWEQIKKKEKGEELHTLETIPKSMPSILYALNVQKKASRLGFDWKEASLVLAKLEEELSELKKAYEEYKNGDLDIASVEEELGDVLFAAINFARLAKIDPEFSLRKVTEKFVNRVKLAEELAEKEGVNFSELTVEELDRFWELAKKVLNNKEF